ncbi:MAG TPA: YfhO family protein, partial [Chloroflexota bacterium]
WRLFTPSPADRRWIQPGDFSDQFYPWARYLSDELLAGRLPLWNPYVFAGHPFHADPQAAVFYPIGTALALALGRGGLSYRALELELPIHFALAALASFLLARRLTGSALAGTIAGIAYGFGGFLTSYPAQQLAVLRTAAWLPLWLYCLERALGAPRCRPRWLVAGAAVMAVMLLAGHSQSALYALYLGVAYALWRAHERGHGLAVGLAAAALPALLGAGLAAIQLIPTAELVAISTRDRLPYDAAAYGYELKALPGALLPAWRGERALYVGVPILLLAALALSGRARSAVFWGAVAGFALLVSLGGNTLLYRVLWLVAPGWSTFRDQERSAAVWSLAMAVLAAHGLVALRALEPDCLRRVAGRLALATLASLAFAAEVLVLWTARRAEERNPFDSLLEAAVFLALVLGLTTLLIALWPRVGPRAAGGLLVALVLFDLFTVNGANNQSDQDPSVVLAREAALARPRAESEPYRLRSDDDKLVPPNYAMVWRAPFMSGDSPIQLRRTHDLLDSREEWRLWQLFNVKYLLSRGERDDPGLEPLGQGADLRVYAVRFSLPRAWAVSDVRVVPDDATALATLLSDAIHPGDTALVAEPPPLPIQPGLPRPDVRVRSAWSNGLEVEVRSTGNALLVVADAWHPGWRADLDGRSVPILRTNHAFRGVAIPAGQHVVTMRYRPGSLYLGAAITAASLAIGLALLLWPRPGR